jgi:hypothetical protein
MDISFKRFIDSDLEKAIGCRIRAFKRSLCIYVTFDRLNAPTEQTEGNEETSKACNTCENCKYNNICPECKTSTVNGGAYQMQLPLNYKEDTNPQS